jgi:hypothetical protein
MKSLILKLYLKIKFFYKRLFKKIKLPTLPDNPNKIDSNRVKNARVIYNKDSYDCICIEIDGILKYFPYSIGLINFLANSEIFTDENFKEQVEEIDLPDEYKANKHNIQPK